IAEIVAVLVDQMNLTDADLFIDARAVLLDGCRRSHGTTNGGCLLGCYKSLQNRGDQRISQRHCAVKSRPWLLRIAVGCGETRTGSAANMVPSMAFVSDRLEIVDIGADAGARQIAVRHRAGAAPGLFWLGALRSDMQGTKAVALDRWSAAQGRACIGFDYSGHGESGGAFTDGTIG